jgi:hypothetical protein
MALYSSLDDTEDNSNFDSTVGSDEYTFSCLQMEEVELIQRGYKSFREIILRFGQFLAFSHSLISLVMSCCFHQ